MSKRSNPERAARRYVRVIATLQCLRLWSAKAKLRWCNVDEMSTTHAMWLYR